MKNISYDGNGGLCFDNYFKYLESISEYLGQELYSFFADWERYNLDSPKSLHDAWLCGFYFKTKADGKSDSPRLTLEFLGPYHDRKISFHYLKPSNIDLFELEILSERNLDVETHEVIFEGSNMKHSIYFEDNKHITITSASIRYTEVILRPGRGSKPVL